MCPVSRLARCGCTSCAGQQKVNSTNRVARLQLPRYASLVISLLHSNNCSVLTVAPTLVLLFTAVLLPACSSVARSEDDDEHRFDSSSTSDFSKWFTWCQNCRHGGHAHHINEATHTTLIFTAIRLHTRCFRVRFPVPALCSAHARLCECIVCVRVSLCASHVIVYSGLLRTVSAQSPTATVTA